MTPLPKRKADWNRLQPISLLHAMELCLGFAVAHNKGIQRIAAQMGLPSHWAIYKWQENGKMPSCLIPAFEAACGINYMTRWLAATAGKLLVDMPKGQAASEDELVELPARAATAAQLLKSFYAAPDRARADEVLAVLRSHMEQVAAHHANVVAYQNPELDF